MMLAILPLLFSLKDDLKRLVQLRKNYLTYLIIIWASPSFLFYLCVHFGNRGYLMTVFSAFILIHLLLLNYFYARRKILVNILLGIIILAQIFLFLLPIKNFYYSRKQIEKFDINIAAYIKGIEQYDPDKVAIVTENNFYYQGNDRLILKPNNYFRQMEYYLPDYSVYEIFWDDNLFFEARNHKMSKLISDNEVPVKDSTEKIIVVADTIDDELIEMNNIDYQLLKNNKKLFYIDFNDSNQVNYYNYTFSKSDVL